MLHVANLYQQMPLAFEHTNPHFQKSRNSLLCLPEKGFRSCVLYEIIVHQTNTCVILCNFLPLRLCAYSCLKHAYYLFTSSSFQMLRNKERKKTSTEKWFSLAV